MDQYDSGLFTELGELMGHDPVLYEDIPKQHNVNFVSQLEGFVQPTETPFPELDGFGEPISGVSELDSLLAEGNHLLEQLMSANGLDLASESPVIDLADIDELVHNTMTPSAAQYMNTTDDDQDLLADIHTMADPIVYNSYPMVSSPTSSIATLPSEPSSPIDLASLQQPFYDNVQPVQTAQSEPEFTDLLQSLIDETVDDGSSGYYDESVVSPTSSEASYSYSSQSWDDSESTYSPVPVKPTKAKKKSKSTPYSKLPAGRKERKKQQNKEAAIRYREKKRAEAQQVTSEEDQLAQRNKDLKTEVTNLEREIMCMKELLSDVFNIHSY